MKDFANDWFRGFGDDPFYYRGLMISPLAIEGGVSASERCKIVDRVLGADKPHEGATETSVILSDALRYREATPPDGSLVLGKGNIVWAGC